MEQRTTEFNTFWTAFPRRIGKLAAAKAYRRARTQASAVEILDGIARYIAHKPSYADFCHPATWLNQGRWMDDYGPAPAPKPSQSEDWFQECKSLHNLECGGSRKHAMKMEIDAMKAAARAAS